MKQSKIIKWLDEHLEETIMAVFLTVIFVVMMVQLILRLFNSALSWAEECTRWCLICSGFFSLGFTIKKGNILKVDVITGMFPKKGQEILNIILLIVTGVFFGYMCVNCYGLIGKIKATGQLSAAMELPIYWLYVVGFIGFLLATIRCIQGLIQQLFLRKEEEGIVDKEEKSL